MTAISPGTKAARHAQIAAILAQTARPVRSQEELAERLGHQGVRVTQATLSRDLEELGAVRLRGRDGALVYALPVEPGASGPVAAGLGGSPAAPATAAGQGATAAAGTAAQAAAAALAPGLAAEPSARLARVTSELLVSAEASANLVVLRTPAGGAQFLASVIDHAGWPTILGTVAGDDTVLIITRDPAGGDDLVRALLRLAERRSQPAGRQ